MKNSLPKIVVILGPTASGKSDLAVSLAQKYNGEIISADSRQVYKGLDIGTGKITKKEMQKIPHHLLDVISAKHVFSVHDYKDMAHTAIADILKKNKLPIVCGGTGFYIQAIVDNIVFPDVKPNLELRKKLENKTPAQLFSMLEKLDPDRAKTIDENNPHRLIRAIEIAKELGKVPSFASEPLYNSLQIGITTDELELKKRIHKRLLKRLKQGMIKEIEHLHEAGLSWKRMIELGLEYRYIALFLTQKMTRKEMIEKLESEIWHYAKRQMTWFKRDSRIVWYTIKDQKKIQKEIEKFLK